MKQRTKERLAGSADLLCAVVGETTGLVEETHSRVAAQVFGPLRALGPTAGVAKTVQLFHDATTNAVYRAIRGGAWQAGRVLDRSIALVPVTDDATSIPPLLAGDGAADEPVTKRGQLADHAAGIVNGLYGDYLARRGNGLDLGMELLYGGQPLALTPSALADTLPLGEPRACLFVHGLACTDQMWTVQAQEFYGTPAVSFGSQLQTELGITPLYLRYNSGRHVSENGRRLSHLLDELAQSYPGGLQELVLVGHSMGGLVVRSAAEYGRRHDAAWLTRVKTIICIGAPNLGAPLERATNGVTNLLRRFDLAGTQIPAQLLDVRSAGIKDLRFGYIVDEEWQAHAPDALLVDNRQAIPLVAGISYHTIGGTLTQDPGHPATLLLGDLLVRPASATGRAGDPTRRISFHSGRVFPGINHFHLANHPDVYGLIRQHLDAEATAAAAAAGVAFDTASGAV